MSDDALGTFTDAKPDGRKPAAKATVTVANRSDVADYDAAAAIERRLAGDPFGARSVPVPMREPQRWALFEANSLADRNMHYRMVHELGWAPVRMDDLQPGLSPESIGWQVGDGGQLCRGVQGDQRLYKQPMDVRRQIAEAKTRANMKGMGSAKAVKQAVTEATGALHGNEAAEFAHANITVTGSDRVGPLGS